jgi:DNA-binding NtrC family response regulator
MSEQNKADETAPNCVLEMKLPSPPTILIVCDNEADTDALGCVLREAGLACERVRHIAAACELARCGGFQLVFTSPFLEDGSWRHLIDLAHHHELGFEIVLLGRTFSDKEWAQALQEGVYDVLDVLTDLPRAAQVAKSAAGADYLRRFRPRAKQAA